MKEKEGRMNWRYCVVRKHRRVCKKTIHYYDIHEVFIVKGKIESWTEESVDPNGCETVEGMKWTLAMMLADSFKHPIMEIKKGKLVERSK